MDLEYGPGYRFSDTQLVGVQLPWSLLGSPSPAFKIREAVSYHGPSDTYSVSHLSVGFEVRLEGFPGGSQGQIGPDRDLLRKVRARDPSMAFWTEQEVPAFADARGFYASSDLVQFVHDFGVLNLGGLVYHEVRDEGVIGYGEADSLKQMGFRWRESILPYVDGLLADHLRSGGGDDEDLFKLTRSLGHLSFGNEADVVIDDRLRNFVAMDERYSGNDSLLKSHWTYPLLGTKAEGVSGESVPEIRARVDAFKDRLLGE